MVGIGVVVVSPFGGGGWHVVGVEDWERRWRGGMGLCGWRVKGHLGMSLKRRLPCSYGCNSDEGLRHSWRSSVISWVL